MRDVLKYAFWYGKWVRQMSLESTTPQPLKFAWMDSSVLFLEEITWHLSMWVEQVLRSILNRDPWWIGRPGKNVVINYRSTIFACGERMTRLASVNNRFVIVPYNSRVAMPWSTSRDILNLQMLSVVKDFYKKMCDIWPELLCTLYKNCADTITGYDKRTLTSRCYLFTMNRLFQLEDEDYIIDVMKNFLIKLWMWFDENKIDFNFFIASSNSSQSTVQDLISESIKKGVPWQYKIAFAVATKVNEGHKT